MLSFMGPVVHRVTRVGPRIKTGSVLQQLSGAVRAATSDIEVPIDHGQGWAERGTVQPGRESDDGPVQGQ